jgi:hypothetical protein
LPRADDSIVFPESSNDPSGTSAPTTRVPWARSPPRRAPR